jgi:predicted 2-oxoglutarate/Fe(II)-dependent dioxygenase YbiX
MLIEEFPGAVSPDLCAKIIAAFERDPGRKASRVIVEGKAAKHEFRSGTQLAFSRQSPEWEALFMAVVPVMRTTMEQYMAKHRGLAELVDAEGLDCTLPMIERVDPGQGFDWHYDATRPVTDRVVAGLLYLNDVTEAGETEFIDGLKVKPAAGKIVLFPPYWTHFHRGVSPTREAKYVWSYFWIYPAKRTP